MKRNHCFQRYAVQFRYEHRNQNHYFGRMKKQLDELEKQLGDLFSKEKKDSKGKD